MNRRTFNRTALVALAGAALWPAPPAARATQPSASAPQGAGGTVETITRTEAQWRALLTDEQYEVLREKGTERAFSGRYDKFYEPGAAPRCAARAATGTWATSSRTARRPPGCATA
jgi:hypothetical protein